jgi:Zn-dependent protease
MTRSLTIAKLGGIDIRLHPTVALIFLWVLVDWRQFGIERGAGAIFSTVILVILIFVCVLLHEFGHVFMAREQGVHVHDVSLSAIGGVSRMDQMPGDPRSEIMIALAGPAVNVALVIALAPVVLLIGIVRGFASLEDYALTVFSPSVAGLLTTLLYANLLIVLFNLLPAFPMDGGRVLRAGLTPMLGRERATRMAATIGYTLAGVTFLLDVVVVHSVVLALLSLFIAVMAYAEDRAVRVESTLRRLPVGQFALWDMGGIAPDLPLTYALRGGPRDIVVTHEGKVLGMLWRNRLLAELGAASGRTVGEVMDQNIPVVDVDTPIYDVHRLMSEQNRWAVPVTEQGQYRGVFTADRFLHLYRQLSPDPVKTVREFAVRTAVERARA